MTDIEDSEIVPGGEIGDVDTILNAKWFYIKDYVKDVYLTHIDQYLEMEFCLKLLIGIIIVLSIYFVLKLYSSYSTTEKNEKNEKNKSFLQTEMYF
jgi:hypothetical protein